MSPIVWWPDRMLSAPTRKVVDFGPELAALLERMQAELKEAQGIGLAANQIGVSLRVALVSPEQGESFEMVNPQITARRGEVLLDEACLSVPREGEQVHRALEVDVTFQDKSGAPHTLTATGHLAHIIQHEVDHLDGRVYVELLGTVKRDLIRRRMQRRKRFGIDESEED